MIRMWNHFLIPKSALLKGSHRYQFSHIGLQLLVQKSTFGLKMDKIKYRLVYNRKKQLNKQGTALVQVEALLNQRKVYFRTNLYLKPEHWNSRNAQVDNHPQAHDLNSMLFEFVLHLQAIELSLWKRGIPVTLSLLKDAIKKDKPVNVTFPVFARIYVQESDRKRSTKENLLTTITVLQEFRPGLDFKDITYTFLRDFEVHLKEKGNSVNTVAKHMRQLRTLVNEAINQGYIPSDAYPFRKNKIKQEKGRKEFLTPDELKRLENLDVDKKLRHVLDAFLFCCYTGLRFSDFCQLSPANFIKINGKRWLHFTSVKTGVELRLPLHLLFEGKALAVLERYDIVTDFAKIGPNSEANKYLAQLATLARIRKHITYHTARHLDPLFLLKFRYLKQMLS